MMMRIAFLVRSLEYGGAETQLVTLARALDKEFFDVTVMSFYAGGPLAEALDGAGIRVVSLDKRGRWDWPGFTRRLVRELKRARPEVLHGYLDIPNIVAVFVKLFSPSTKIVWGVRASGTDLSRYEWPRRLGSSLERILSRFADLIIVNSESGRGHLLTRGFPASKIVVIPNGIDTERFRPDPAARARVRDEWGIPEDTTLIGLVARLDPIKEHRTFLRAAALLCGERPDVRFVCVGGGGAEYYARELVDLSERLGLCGKVIWAGARTDTPSVYNALDIACSCSDYGEGFPNVIGEAMACGVPCVVTDTGDAAAIVAGTGVVVPPRDAKALAEGFRLCMTRTRTEAEARARVVENYSVRHLAERTQAALLALR